MHVIIRADASSAIGAGHVMRCLVLADRLQAIGAVCHFVCRSFEGHLARFIEARGHHCILLEVNDDPPVAAGYNEAPPAHADWLGAGWQQDARATIEIAQKLQSAALVIVDHYALDHRWESLLKRHAKRLMVVDDLADRAHDCDILVDQTAGREPAEYAALVPPSADVRVGARFALLRPEFAHARPAALAARLKGRPVSRILVSLGMTDIGGVTGWAVRAALAAGLDAEIAVAVGSRAESLSDLRDLADTDPRVVLYIDCTEVCALMANSDIAIGAGGTSSWERCCLGLPTIMLLASKNQRMIGRNLARLGAVKLLHDHEEGVLTAALRSLAADASTRVKMSRAASAVTNGMGAKIIAESLKKHIVARKAIKGGQRTNKTQDVSSALIARAADNSDCEEIWMQRNDTTTRRNARNSNPVSWLEHKEWFKRALTDPDRMICMVDAIGLAGDACRGMAVVRFDPSGDSDESWRVSMSLSRAFRGLGLGALTLRAATRFFFERHGIVNLSAEIREGNIASERIFTALGFRRVSAPETPGFRRYIRPRVELK